MIEQQQVQVHREAPEEFDAQVEVSACYVRVGERLLLLQRSASSSEGGRWGVPAGKVEEGEAPLQAAERELKEETGIGGRLMELGLLYVRKPEIEYLYHAFSLELNRFPEVELSEEHQGFVWAGAAELDSLDLMAGASEALAQYNQMRGES